MLPDIFANNFIKNLSVVDILVAGIATENRYKSIVVPFTNAFGIVEFDAISVSEPVAPTVYTSAYIEEFNELAVILAYSSKFQFPPFIEETPGSPTGVMNPPKGIDVPGPFAVSKLCVPILINLSKS